MSASVRLSCMREDSGFVSTMNGVSLCVSIVRMVSWFNADPIVFSKGKVEIHALTCFTRIPFLSWTIEPSRLRLSIVVAWQGSGDDSGGAVVQCCGGAVGSR